MLEHLIRIAPGGCDRGELADAVEMEEGGGSFGTYLSRLRSNGLLREEGGRVFAAEELIG